MYLFIIIFLTKRTFNIQMAITSLVFGVESLDRVQNVRETQGFLVVCSKKVKIDIKKVVTILVLWLFFNIQMAITSLVFGVESLDRVQNVS